jgi:hypothetical protein
MKSPYVIDEYSINGDIEALKATPLTEFINMQYTHLALEGATNNKHLNVLDFWYSLYLDNLNKISLLVNSSFCWYNSNLINWWIQLFLKHDLSIRIPQHTNQKLFLAFLETIKESGIQNHVCSRDSTPNNKSKTIDNLLSFDSTLNESAHESYTIDNLILSSENYCRNWIRCDDPRCKNTRATIKKYSKQVKNRCVLFDCNTIYYLNVPLLKFYLNLNYHEIIHEAFTTLSNHIIVSPDTSTEFLDFYFEELAKTSCKLSLNLVLRLLETITEDRTTYQKKILETLDNPIVLNGEINLLSENCIEMLTLAHNLGFTIEISENFSFIFSYETFSILIDSLSFIFDDVSICKFLMKIQANKLYESLDILYSRGIKLDISYLFYESLYQHHKRTKIIVSWICENGYILGLDSKATPSEIYLVKNDTFSTRQPEYCFSIDNFIHYKNFINRPLHYYYKNNSNYFHSLNRLFINNKTVFNKLIELWVNQELILDEKSLQFIIFENWYDKEICEILREHKIQLKEFYLSEYFVKSFNWGLDDQNEFIQRITLIEQYLNTRIQIRQSDITSYFDFSEISFDFFQERLSTSFSYTKHLIDFKNSYENYQVLIEMHKNRIIELDFVAIFNHLVESLLEQKRRSSLIINCMILILRNSDSEMVIDASLYEKLKKRKMVHNILNKFIGKSLRIIYSETNETIDVPDEFAQDLEQMRFRDE